jgi:heme-degrading monooxygenase HmoA
VQTSPAEEWNYLIVWEFRVSHAMAQRFEQEYGTKGVWERLFRGAPGYVRSQLVRDPAQPGRYLTLDFWTSRQAYESFRREHAAEYKEIDRDCEKLTETELQIGGFEPV